MAKKITSEELMAGILSYLGVLVLIPLFLIKKKTDFAKFHIQQGMNLFLLFVGLWLVSIVLAFVPIIGWIVAIFLGIFQIVLAIFALVAILKAVQGESWKMPLVSGLKLFDISNLK